MRILDGRKDAKNSPLQSPQDRLTACGKWFEYPPQNQSTRASSTLISNPFAECTTIAIHMLELRYVLEHSLNCERAPRLLRYLLGHGADEFSIAVMTLQDTPAPFADAFEDELGPYERPTAFRRVLTNAESVDMTRRIRLWALNETSLARLLSFMDTGLLEWPAGPDGWLEDLTIYRRGELVLGVVSHEQEGVLRLTHQEHADVAALDIPSEPTAKWIDY